MTLFILLAIPLTIVAVGMMILPLVRSGENTHPVAAVLIALATPAAVLLVYLTVSNHNWLAGAVPTQVSGSIEEAVAALETRLASVPDDAEGWVLLGNSYLSLNRPADSAKAFQRALEVSGGDSTAAKLGLAEARIVLDPGSLLGPAGTAIEEVLALEPRNPKALWYGGMQALARGEPELVRARWQTLLELAPPERIREIIETQLLALEEGGDAGQLSDGAQAARQHQAAADAPAASGREQPNEPGTGIAVRVSVGDELVSRVSPSAPVFVFVREEGVSGPPLAVIRRQARDLPLDLRISDADVMLPGRTLAGITAATLVARIANGGDPIAKPGDLYGDGRWQPAGVAGGPVAIVINQVVSP